LKLPIVLRIYFNDKLEGVKQFTDSQIVIGRNAEVQVDLQEEGVSPLHAVFEDRGGRYYVSDLGSQTGTLLNGKKVLDEPIQSGDEIKIGSYKIQFFIGIPKPVSAPQSAEIPNPAPLIPPSRPVVHTAPSAAKPTPVAAVTPPPLPKSVPVSQESDEDTQEIDVNPQDSIGEITQPKIPVEAKVAEVPVATIKTPERRREPAKSIKTLVKENKKTFAPPSVKTADELIKPGKGTIVEVVVAWKERVILTKHFSQKGVVTIGSSDKADITVPILTGVSSYPIVEIDNIVKVNVAPNTPGSLITSDRTTSFIDLAKQNRFQGGAAGHQLTLGQGEMVRIGFQGDLINVYVRFVSETPKPLAAPLLDLTTTEITGVVLAAVVSAIFGVYMFLYAPSSLNDEARLEEPIRKATVTFKPPPRTRILEMEQKEEKPPEEKKVVKVVEKQRQTQTPSVEKEGSPGKAGEVAPKDTTDTTKKVTSARPGGAVKTSPKQGANMKSEKPDPTKVGLLSVFGSKGAQSKLDKAFSGSGELQGMADQATGYSGDNENREGDTFGSKIKDTGAGGKGEQTVGIAGVGTKGKGTGNYGLGTGGIGTKGSVDINVGGQEAEFVGSMDREAIRRVILNNKSAIRSCYERELQRKPDLYGKVVLQWYIMEKGRVSEAKVKENDMGSSAVADCIISRLRTWRFPEPPPGTIGEVSYPFVFSSQ
jgi:hypothetical protein